MTTSFDHDLDRRLDAWFAEGPMTAPDPILTDLPGRLARQRQRPAWLVGRDAVRVWAPVRLLAAAAALVAVVVGGSLLVGGGGIGPGPSPSPTPTPTREPTPKVLGSPLESLAPAEADGLTFPVEAPPTGPRLEAPIGTRNISVTYGARLVLVGETCDSTPDPAAGPDASSILAALQARPGWIVGAPTPVTLGAASGWWFDLRRPDDLVCPDGGINIPLFVSDLDQTATDAPAVHIDPGYASRLFLLDDGRGGTIVIDINAHRSFGQPALVEAAMPVLLASRFTP